MADLSDDEKKLHRKQAVELFNMVWDYMEKTERNPAENDTMLNAAHASRYHWELVGNAQNLSVGEWQISRVYALLKRPEPSAYHGARSLQHATEGDLPPFYFAYAHEALARAAAVAGDRPTADKHKAAAAGFAEKVVEEGDRKSIRDDLATI